MQMSAWKLTHCWDQVEQEKEQKSLVERARIKEQVASHHSVSAYLCHCSIQNIALQIWMQHHAGISDAQL